MKKIRIASIRRGEGGDYTTMTAQPRKMSEIMKEMAERLLRHSSEIPSLEAANVALFFANAAWNESIGVAHSRDSYRNVWEPIEAGNPELWNEFKSNDINALIDELVQYKKTHYPDDQRRILTCGYHGWQHSCGMAQSRRPWGRFPMGDAALRAGEDGRS